MDAVSKALKDITLARGRKAEDKFFEAMRTSASADMPRWFRSVRRPTFKEDRYEGKDAVIETTDVGKLFLQIKSSKAGETHFKKSRHSRRNKFISVIVILERDTLEDVRIKARVALSQLRQEILNKRNITEW
ncbi:MAG: hypothetical protein A2937_03710 [Candidatus Yonathbacteria bacterium RIFCSPLOWO2_01_FULL_47_33b]|uniref:PD(D/E)XK endonuclease domain-containing protein n=1 Tax=Candidatus Yonathbacteria bacterium RIFCSPLOWO2_01_FULL_47_33b TaxID=1802727 RepID=A0A1G2SFD6_9BACT|nr:MAG: hypothetical protein A2937_03710 [Candidatus Yonathbacteria bacterium RIFCSPLOWO2_01_FULL_47_33b]